jgi:hypothetical protein
MRLFVLWFSVALDTNAYSALGMSLPIMNIPGELSFNDNMLLNSSTNMLPVF